MDMYSDYYGFVNPIDIEADRNHSPGINAYLARNDDGLGDAYVSRNMLVLSPSQLTLLLARLSRRAIRVTSHTTSSSSARIASSSSSIQQS